MIVAAMSGNGEHLAATAREQHLVAADVSEQHATIGNIGKGNALGQVRAAGLVVFVSHVVLP
jgi:hypothetical protein